MPYSSIVSEASMSPHHVSWMNKKLIKLKSLESLLKSSAIRVIDLIISHDFYLIYFTHTHQQSRCLPVLFEMVIFQNSTSFEVITR